ncbi:YybH family protein [Lutispora thermophila]|uniref:Ketosteroid isomerase homolog n=1 Tax=Lutispora thermophila DSM 19022 TaxID=1122184 RepID=A0A1M6HCY8_9FIRM|nr:nuclear transport factor 2 family protein [Lutispora thermophila]SHJ20062.1 Ketosteroid isomerase homolog [Lutispora thermophila DSM 19022]
MNFKEVLNLHLKAIENKDLETFITTISKEDVTLIMPNGTLINGREEFIEFHKDWFSDKDWTLNYEILKIEEGEEASFALLKVNYKDIDFNGNEYSLNYYLTLLFKKIDGEWGLIYDQNTLFNNK